MENSKLIICSKGSLGFLVSRTHTHDKNEDPLRCAFFSTQRCLATIDEDQELV